MKLNEYQTWQETMRVYPKPDSDTGLNYCIVALAGEAGEVANDWKKILRDNKPVTIEAAGKLALELGDVLWYVSAVAGELGFTLQNIAEMNQVKLKQRYSK
jgi:NTP pyrophosphatase (non-canonical NTP hydrolase)